MIRRLLPLAALLAAFTVSAADPGDEPLFEDLVLVKGEGVEVRRSQLDEAFLQFKANAAAQNRTIPEDRRDALEMALLDRLLVTRLLLNRATDDDRRNGAREADIFLSNLVAQATSESAYVRQLMVLGFSRDAFEKQVLDRAISEEVVERVLRPKVEITDAELRRYYDENSEKFQRPEMFRAAHILLSTLDPVTRQPLSAESQAEKRKTIEDLLKRARAGEDFAELARTYSEDPRSRSTGGEYTFPRGSTDPAFERATEALEPNQVSDVVTTQFGLHIIKLYQVVPAERLEFDKIASDLREQLTRKKIQEDHLPGYLESLKQQAGLRYLNGASAPKAPVTTDPVP